MSAIWGAVDLDGKPIAPAECRILSAPFAGKKIDKIQTLCRDSVYLACGLQYVNAEACREQYPYTLGTGVVTADAILDNRPQLQAEFLLRQSLSQEGVDGSILAECVTQDLSKALDTMLGAFVFALYTPEGLTLANDAVGERSVYYTVQGKRLYFSSLMASLLPFLPERHPCQSWFLNYFALNDLRITAEPRLTPYQDIYRLEPGEVLHFTSRGLHRRAYWDPLKKPSSVSRSDSAEALLPLWRSAVEDRIRSDAEVGILLSGGLDSNAAAAFAAPRLEALGKPLYSFTSVPDVRNPIPISSAYYVPDERSYIALLQKRHPNLVPELISCRDYDYPEICRQAMEILEFPFKTVPNMPWLLEGYRRAAERGCRTLLTGQYGNITISFGTFENLFETLIAKGQLISLYRQIAAFSRTHHRGRRWVCSMLSKSLYPQFSSLRSTPDLNPLLCRQAKHALRHLCRQPVILPNALHHVRHYMYDRSALRQVGEAEIKLSLETGVIPRDPTRDKRVIALVAQLPIQDFVWDGLDRRLVRSRMAQWIPEEICRDIAHRGQQGVGANENFRQNGAAIAEALRQEFRTGHAEAYLNLPYLEEQLNNLELWQQSSTAQAVRLMYCGLCSEFLGSHYDR